MSSESPEVTANGVVGVSEIRRGDGSVLGAALVERVRGRVVLFMVWAEEAS